MLFRSDDVSIDGILGTGNAESDNTLLAILPNPSNGKVQIQCGNKNFSKTKVQLIDATGRIVYSENLQNTSAFWTQTMDWSAQPKGVYFVKLISDAKVFTQKIVLE